MSLANLNRYAPLSPNDALDALIAEKEERILELKERKAGIISSFNKINREA